MTTPNDLQSKLEAITQAAVGALGFLPVNVPGARMAKERIEAVLAEMGVALPDEPVTELNGRERMRRFALCRHDILMHECESCRPIPLSDPEPTSEPRAIVDPCVACERHRDGFDEPCWVHGADGAAQEDS